MAVAGAAGLQVIEDAAQAHGASHAGRKAGSWGLAASFSFYPGKNLGAYGDAGAVATNSSGIADSIEALRNHGSRARYDHPVTGFNCRLDTLQAVVLKAKLSQLDRWNEARRTAAARYDRMLADVPGVIRPSTRNGNDHVWHLYVVRVPERDRLLATMQAAGIPVAIHYPTPLHLVGAFARLNYGPGDFPVAEKACSEILSLPMHPHLTEAQRTAAWWMRWRRPWVDQWTPRPSCTRKPCARRRTSALAPGSGPLPTSSREPWSAAIATFVITRSSRAGSVLGTASRSRTGSNCSTA